MAGEHHTLLLYESHAGTLGWLAAEWVEDVT